MLEDGLGDGGDDDEAGEGDEHGHGTKGEILLSSRLVVERVVNNSRHSDVRLPSCRHRWRCSDR